MQQTVLEVVSGLLERDGRHLIAQRLENDRYGLYWEFPGGVVEDGETHQEALRRELQEELGIDVAVGPLLHVYEDEIPDLKIVVSIYRCEIRHGEPRPYECKDTAWVNLKALDSTILLAPADKKFLDWFLTQEHS
ncbi:MAG: (deoxy)nucleoside triphosphate pyrophosphohydrolase [Candidatus Omnitrophica bacterium]|nr:(deoxy)nucleoside triphosphate pyrophosphohydrolase [Candidatus Omnitrophota bacterium]